MRKVFLENLPRKYGKGANKDKLVIDWKNSMGYNIKFIYDDIEGEIEIIDYYINDNNRTYLIIKYKDKFKSINISNFIKCKIGELFKDNMWNTHRELCEQLGVPKEVAETVTAGSNKPITFNCKCGNEVTINPNKITTYKTIGCKKCSDRSSYPEKFMFNMLTQLGIDFIWQLTKTNFKWCGKYRYDFYFEYRNEKYIIETNGKQHYKEQKRGRTLEEEQQNDRLKYELAIKNGIKPENYIVIDCRYSELDFIKQNILDGRLNEIFDLSYMDWYECEKFALKNIIKEVCDYWENHEINNVNDITTVDLAGIFNLSRHTIREYLKKGVEFGWCKYDPKKEDIKRINKTSKTNRLKLSKPILMYDKEMNFIGEYESAPWLERNSINLFGIKLYRGKIGEVARGKRPQHKGFIFKYK